jgi:CheY-like chemotaxis protein
MAELGRILIADDEQIFLDSTADLLRQRGYECACAPDAQTAVEMMKKQDYDLLIADIKMPGNDELELIRDMPRIAEDMPVILVTAYPSLKSAIESVQLPVVAYLTKPIEFEQLLAQVRVSIDHHRVSRAVRSLRERLQDWRRDLSGIEEALSTVPGPGSSASVDAFLDLTFRNMAGALSDMNHLTKALTTQHVGQEVCHLVNCPKLNTLTNALVDTIRVLEKTKTAFKSKELGDLRKKLEDLVAGVGK